VERNGAGRLDAKEVFGLGRRNGSRGRVDGFVARWSPDGTRLIFQSAVEASAEGSDLATCGADGSDLVMLTQTSSNELTPIWSPDGSTIAFVADYDGGYDLYVMDADGSNVRKVFQAPEVKALFFVRGVAQSGRALRSGRRGPRFKSGRPD
jgi:TolB protein